MAKQLQLRRGTTSEHATFTGAAGEVTVNTTTNGLVVHDGSTAGGHTVGVGLSGLANVQYFTSSGTFTKPTASNFSFIRVTARGGGGSGAASTQNTYQPGYGGNQGALGVVIIQAAALSSTETVTIGSGGAEVSTNPSDGNAGGDSSFGAHITAEGGPGGGQSGVNLFFQSKLQSNTIPVSTGTGVITFGGQLGQLGHYYHQYNARSPYNGGHGGGNGAGAGGQLGALKGNLNGPTDAVGNDGAGGGGMINAAAGSETGAGAPGYVMVEEFYTQ